MQINGVSEKPKNFGLMVKAQYVSRETIFIDHFLIKYLKNYISQYHDNFEFPN